MRKILLSLTQIAPDPDQPRRHCDPGEIEALAWSLAAHGLLHPIHVTPPPREDGSAPYTILVGERRFLAARKLRWSAIPTIIHDPLEPSDRTMVQLAENDLRVPLPLLDRALAVARAIERSGLTQAEFARRQNRTTSSVSKLLWIARSQGLTRRALEENLLAGIEVAREFAALPETQQTQLIERARRNGSRISENAVDRLRLAGSEPPPLIRRPSSTILLELSLAQLQTLLLRLGLNPPADADAGRLELLRQLT